MKKDIIYIDTDDEIAAVADKVATSKSKVVALVLPKRFTMLHSTVNMKILNKAATNNKKNIVLITSEKALMPIAAVAGMYVAKSLQSKPSVPATIAVDTELDDAIVSEEPAIDTSKSIGELAGEPEPDTTIALDNSEPPEAEKDKQMSVKKDKKLVVPNFEKFRLRLIIIASVGVALLVFLYFAIFVMPKALITITVEKQEIPLSIAITASPTKEDNISEKSFKLETKTVDKADTKSTNATGKKDLGEKASGEVTLSIACDAVKSYPVTVPSGTGISTNGLTYISQESVSLANPGGGGGGGCKFSGTVDVKAQNAGGEYNINGGRTFSVAGFSAVSGNNKNGFSGGSSKVITVVTQEDCDKMQNELNTTSNSDEMKNKLTDEFEQTGLVASSDTYKVETVSSTCEPSVGQEASTVTAKATYRYTLSGVKADSLEKLINQEALAKAGQGQTVASTGIEMARLGVDSRSGSTLNMTVKTVATTGVKQDEEALKLLVKGNNARQTTDALKKIPGVKEVKIDYSPFWVNKTPNKTSRITIVFNATNDN